MVKDPSRNNEALDCRVYARAAASLYGLDRMSDFKWRGLEVSLGVAVEIPTRGVELPARATYGPPGRTPNSAWMFSSDANAARRSALSGADCASALKVWRSSPRSSDVGRETSSFRVMSFMVFSFSRAAPDGQRWRSAKSKS